MAEEPTFVNERAESVARPAALTLPELVSTIGEKAKLLVMKEVQLARTELKADVKSELATAKSFAVAGVAFMLGVQMLLVSLAFVLAAYMETWVAALVIAAPFLALGIAAGLIGWGKRVKKPLDATRASVKESVEWAKNRLA
ncbi:MAG TPA: phage holin family protein [Thermoanaerobaculia bacterium]|nr:phage holin family protein [Thermoanaerobaculia bacterium]